MTRALPYDTVERARTDSQANVNAMLDQLRACFGGKLLTDAANMAPFLTDWRRRWNGRALAVAQPETAGQAAAIMGWCSRHGVPVVAQGGNTGLSGGSVPDASGHALVVSLARLNRVRGVDPSGQTLTAEAGCTVQTVQEAAAQAGRLFPLSLASEGSCTVGGVLSTNAGGVHVLRYGNARALCLGLEVVTPSGEIWDGLRHLHKDNSGLDLRDLFIGAEGTLGIITAAVLRLHPRPADRSVAIAAVPSPEAARHLLGLAGSRAGAGLTAFELMNALSLDLVRHHRPGVRLPLQRAWPWTVLVEMSVWQEDVQASDGMVLLLEAALADGCVQDAAIGSTVGQCQAFWAMREAISDAQAAEGSTIKHDVALPLAGLPSFIEAADRAMHRHFPAFRLVVFGHLGDGNLHYNVSPPAGRCGPEHHAWFVSQEQAVNSLVHGLVAEHGGSISAEHGVGVLRREAVTQTKSAVELRLMAAVKNALDPRGLMNPGKGVILERPWR